MNRFKHLVALCLTIYCAYVTSISVRAEESISLTTFITAENPIVCTMQVYSSNQTVVSSEIYDLPNDASVIPWINGERAYCILQPTGHGVYDVVSPDTEILLCSDLIVPSNIEPVCFVEEALYCYCHEDKLLVSLSSDGKTIVLRDIADEQYIGGMSNIVVSERGLIAFVKSCYDEIGDINRYVFISDGSASPQLLGKGALPFWYSTNELCFIEQNQLYIYDLVHKCVEPFLDTTGEPLMIDATPTWTNSIQYVNRLHSIYYTVQEDSRIGGFVKIFTYNVDIKEQSLLDQNDVHILRVGKPINRWYVE